MKFLLCIPVDVTDDEITHMIIDKNVTGDDSLETTIGTMVENGTIMIDRFERVSEIPFEIHNAEFSTEEEKTHYRTALVNKWMTETKSQQTEETEQEENTTYYFDFLN